MASETAASEPGVFVAEGCDGIATMNLRCALGLPGSEDVAIHDCLKVLNFWATAVGRYSAHCAPDFDRRPHQYAGRRSFFWMLSMATLLKHPRGGIGISYEPSAIGSYCFRDSRHDFLHGLISRRRGTCASLPVLFVAIGRRLGYPVHMALAKGHYFCQWEEDDGSYTDFEVSGPGGCEMCAPGHFRQWPRMLSEEDLASGRYLFSE